MGLEEVVWLVDVVSVPVDVKVTPSVVVDVGPVTPSVVVGPLGVVVASVVYDVVGPSVVVTVTPEVVVNVTPEVSVGVVSGGIDGLEVVEVVVEVVVDAVAGVVLGPGVDGVGQSIITSFK